MENNLIFTPLSLNGMRARQIKYYFHTSTGNSNRFNEVSQLWQLRNRERQIALFGFPTLRFWRRAREEYNISELLSHIARICLCK